MRLRKRRAAPTGLLAALLALTLCACAPAEEPPADTAWTPEQMARALWEAGGAAGEPTVLLPGDPLYDAHLAEHYGLEAGAAADGAVLLAGGADPREAAVLLLADGTDPEEAAGELEKYLSARAGEFTGYSPEGAALLEGAETVVRGQYLALLAVDDPAAAEEAFDRCFTQPPPEETPPAETAGPAPADSPEPTDSPVPSDAPVPAETTQPSPEPEPSPSPEPEPEPEPEAPWSYDEGRLLEAWTAGDWSGLHEKDRAILDRCREVLDTVVPAGGSEYDRELAVHDWMVGWASYDSNTLSLLPDFREDPDNGNPYGLLVNGRGICSGYTSTFQLFMDLLGIECITVEGTAYGGSEAHAWNQVRLDGEWYCVDVTWDDPVASFPVPDWMAHSYFNVTGDYMRRTDHQWDESAVPEATGTAYAWHR